MAEKKKLNEMVERFLDEKATDAALSIEVNGQPKNFVQILFLKPATERHCPKCNARQYHDALFCHRCGTRLPTQARPDAIPGLLFNFAYPYSTEPLPLMKSKGIQVPDGSDILIWDKSQSAALSTPMLNAQQVTHLVEEILTNLQGVKINPGLRASIGYGY